MHIQGYRSRIECQTLIIWIIHIVLYLSGYSTWWLEKTRCLKCCLIYTTSGWPPYPPPCLMLVSGLSLDILTISHSKIMSLCTRGIGWLHSNRHPLSRAEVHSILLYFRCALCLFYQYFRCALCLFYLYFRCALCLFYLYFRCALCLFYVYFRCEMMVF